MNTFDQLVEKIVYEVYTGKAHDEAFRSVKEILKEVVACAMMDQKSVDEFLEL